MSKFKVIDLFAGPGGLGEGFASLPEYFDIGISIEKEASAHRTLLLRSFFRQFRHVPEEYYEFLRGERGAKPEDELYKLKKFSKQYQRAASEAQCLELGRQNNKIIREIDQIVGNDPCVLIGGPPCQAYSLVGRARNAGIAGYSAEKDQRNFLYQEYLRIIARYQPVAFVMENVKGILSAKVSDQGVFEQITKDLQQPNKATGAKPRQGLDRHDYEIFPLTIPSDVEQQSSNADHQSQSKNFLIHSERYGVPQRRHRVILLGLRSDYSKRRSSSVSLTRTEHQATLQEVIGDLPALRSGLSKGENSHEAWEVMFARSLPEIAKKLRASGLNEIGKEIRSVRKLIKSPRHGQGGNLGVIKRKSIRSKNLGGLAPWLEDERLEGFICNHQSRGHIEGDLHRYLFASVWAKVASQNNSDSRFPKASDYPDFLKPRHKNFDSGKFADRFRVQLPDMAATTITSHIAKDGHYFIHYDPAQCRSLTVREAARVQTFPDNYFFVGNRTQQYVQVGNAVPPWLARQIAIVVSKIIS